MSRSKNPPEGESCQNGILEAEIQNIGKERTGPSMPIKIVAPENEISSAQEFRSWQKALGSFNGQKQGGKTVC